MIASLLGRFRRPKAPATKPEPLDLILVPWLMATAAVTVLPHFATLPVWLPVGAGVAMAWRGWLWRQGVLTANRWLVMMLAGAGTIGILFQYRTIFGQDPGIALLVLLMSLKLMELRSARDAVVVVTLGYFLLLTHYLEAETIPVGLWMLLAMLVTTATLIRLQAPHAGSRYATFKTAGSLILQAIPIMIVLFVLFPRISGPLWGLPQDPHRAKTGLSDEMSPGSIGQLTQSTALAFRAEFKRGIPARDLLYWRGPVMYDYDGTTWKTGRFGDFQPPAITPTTGRTSADSANEYLVEYALTLEPHQQRWLLALDLPVKYPAGSFLTPSLSIISRTPVRERRRIEFTSATRYQAGLEESPRTLNRALALPPDINPRSRELAAGWRKQSDNPNVIAAKALQNYRQENFIYTLTPPLLGRNAVDDFLFSSRRGFCEHYASSFVFLMRAAGVPARVVAGYLGGESNPVDGHLAIRQSDAHAWAEIWIQGEGWRRVDPTASIAPNRVEQGLQAALPEGEAVPVMLRPELDWLRAVRYRWDAAEYAWNSWVLGYNADRQRQLLKELGVDNDWRSLIALLSGFMLVLLLILAFWITRRRPPRDPAHALWTIACAAFSARGFPRAQSEGPSDFARRISRQTPALGEIAMTIANHYIRLRYARTDQASSNRNADLTALYREVGKLAPRWKLWSLRLWTIAKN